MPECVVPEGLYLAPFMTRFLFRFDSLHNATKKMLFSDVVAAKHSHQLCIATKAPGALLVFEESTQSEMPNDIPNKGSINDEEWVSVEAGGPDDAWVDVDKGVPSDIGRGASDVSNGTSSPGHTRIVLEVIKEYYKKESSKASNWRTDNVKK
ncbi:hypothetical protein KCU98_g983, partial [Aureobasidium melanogenum]